MYIRHIGKYTQNTVCTPVSDQEIKYNRLLQKKKTLPIRHVVH